jgi:multidrug efflux pump subunit AcrA (membrane-fusion protein)
MKKAVLAATTLLLLLLNAGCGLMRPDTTEVDRSTIIVGEAKRGDFVLREGGDGVLTSDQTAELDVYLLEQQDDVQLGQPAVIRIGGEGGVKTAGRVARVDAPKPFAKDQITRRVLVALTDVPQDAHAGTEVEGRIDVATIQDAIYVPRPALAPVQTLLYRLSPDQTSASPVKVEYGRIGIEYAEILSGLNPGDRVIRSITAQYEPFGKISLR